MTYDFSMSGNFTSAGQLSFFQMPYIQVARRQDEPGKGCLVVFFTHFGTEEWEEMTGDIRCWILVLLKSSTGVQVRLLRFAACAGDFNSCATDNLESK